MGIQPTQAGAGVRASDYGRGVAEPDDAAPDTARAPTPVLLAAALVGIEGLMVLSLVPILVIGGILTGRPDSLSRAWAEVAIAALSGFGILVLARALARLLLWSRGPVVVIQILLLPVGYSLAVGSNQPAYGVPILVASAVVLYLLFIPPESRLVFGRR